jgi:hypothetical protein
MCTQGLDLVQRTSEILTCIEGIAKFQTSPKHKTCNVAEAFFYSVMVALEAHSSIKRIKAVGCPRVRHELTRTCAGSAQDSYQ